MFLQHSSRQLCSIYCTAWATERRSLFCNALGDRATRVSTGRLNKFVAELRDAHPHPIRGGRQPRVLFATQASTRPPTFALFTTAFLEHGYRRFIERRLREEFGFVGTPIRINLRIREKRKRR